MKRKHIWITISVTVLLLFLLILESTPFAIIGSVTKSSQLKLLEDSISEISLTTGREIDRSLQDTEIGFTGPIYADVHVSYEPHSNYTKEEVYNEIVEVLKQKGWVVDHSSDYYKKLKFVQEKYPIPLSVSILINEDTSTVTLIMNNPKS